MVCVVIVAMWAVSTRVIIGWGRSNPQVTVQLGGGVFTGCWTRDTSFRFYGWHIIPFRPGIERPTLMLAPGLFIATIPFWLPFTLAAIPTVILWRRDRRTVKPGCCRMCGYDLRASKMTCPECGAAIAPELR